MKRFKSAFLLSLALGMSLASCGTTTSANDSSAVGEVTSSSSSVSTSTSTSTSTTSSSTSHTGTSSTGHGGNGTGTGGGGTTSTSVTYKGAKEFTTDTEESNLSYSSTSVDESAVLIDNNAKVILNNPTITKSGDTSSADNSSFYGQNASLLVTSGTGYVNGGTVNSTGEGGAGLCAYNTGICYASSTNITTSSNAAGGVHVCGGGTLYGWNLTANTAGEHSAAIRSDRGGGTMVIDGGTYNSTGAGSPAVYSTADITVNGATLAASGSEACAIEGKNSISLYDCDISGSMKDSSENDNTWAVILYQSMSGDSTVGTSVFNMVGGSLDAKNGGFFHSTNTSSEFLLSDVTLKHTGNDSYEYLIRATGSSRWGSGTGPTCNFTASKQTMSGKVIYDSASTLDLYIKDRSKWTGSSEKSTTYTGSKTSSIYLEKGSTWVVDGDSTIDNLYSAGTIVDSSGKTVTIVAGGVTKVTGTSDYTITVTSTYSTSPDFSSAVSTPTYTAIEKPSYLA